MFTGIIQEVGTVAHVERTKGLTRVAIYAPTIAFQVHPLESVAVNGVCLTVVNIRQSVLSFEMIPETQRLTTLGQVRRGDTVNLEPSLRVCDRLNGHLVLGHVDGMGTVQRRRQRASELVVDIRISNRIRGLLVPKGPVTVEGISLTVGATLTPSTFSIHIIPETLRQTTLRAWTVGHRVNIELDYVAKLLYQFVHVVKSKRQRYDVLAQLLRGVTKRNRHAELPY